MAAAFASTSGLNKVQAGKRVREPPLAGVRSCAVSLPPGQQQDARGIYQTRRSPQQLSGNR